MTWKKQGENFECCRPVVCKAINSLDLVKSKGYAFVASQLS